jgi:hypothetical protein
LGDGVPLLEKLVSQKIETFREQKFEKSGIVILKYKFQSKIRNKNVLSKKKPIIRPSSITVN